MRHYLDYKKQFKLHRKLLCNYIGVSCVIGILVFIPYVFSYAETAEEIRDRIDQKNVDIAKLEEQIRIYQGELDTLGKQKDSLSGSIKELDLTKKKLITDISVTQKKIDRTNLKIEGLSSDIGSKEGAILNHRDSIALEIRETNELENQSLITSILSKDDFSTIWNDVDARAVVREKIIENISKLKEIKVVLEDTRSLTVNAKNELIKLKTELADQQKIIVQNANEKTKLLKQTQNSESAYQTLVKAQTAKKIAFEQELRSYESQLKFILDPSKLPSAGVLSWPLDRTYVTQEFGAKTGPHRTYASGHSGTDFRARTPLPVYSMADGVVLGTGDTDLLCPGVSFGKWVFIKYDNGLSSTYGHLSLIKASEGQKVRRGEVVGYTGGTGRSTGPHLHVSLYVSSAVEVSTLPSKSCPGKTLKQPIAATNAYLDPMYYLPKYVPQP
ncbi:MAG: peptidoglycan DD-metalloendopeptidase family protein [Patescibacteria group bacterium]